MLNSQNVAVYNQHTSNKHNEAIRRVIEVMHKEITADLRFKNWRIVPNTVSITSREFFKKKPGFHLVNF